MALFSELLDAEHLSKSHHLFRVYASRYREPKYDKLFYKQVTLWIIITQGVIQSLSKSTGKAPFVFNALWIKLIFPPMPPLVIDLNGQYCGV